MFPIQNIGVIQSGGEWELPNYSYTGNSLDISGEDTLPQGMFLRDDGFKIYFMGRNSDSVYQYDLSTAFDVTTDTLIGNVSVNSEDTFPQAMSFRDNGLRMFMIGNTGDAVYQYTLSSAWTVSTATFDSVSHSVSGQDGTMINIFFRQDGSQFVALGSTNNTVYRYSLSTDWDLSTASFDTGQSFDFTTQDATAQGIFIRPDGKRMFMAGNSNTELFAYSLNSAWDLTTATFLTGNVLDVSGQDAAIRDVFFSPDGQHLYVVGNSTDAIYQYALS